MSREIGAKFSEFTDPIEGKTSFVFREPMHADVADAHMTRFCLVSALTFENEHRLLSNCTNVGLIEGKKPIDIGYRSFLNNRMVGNKRKYACAKITNFRMP